MRILQLVHQFAPEHVGGTELYTHALSHALAEKGHDVTVFHRRGIDGSGASADDSGPYAVRAAWNGRFTPARRFRAAFSDRHVVAAFERVLADKKPDIVHVEHALGLPLAIFERLQAAGIPYVVTLWDFWWVCANAQLLTNYSNELCAGPSAFLNCARCALARSGLPDFALLRPPLAVPHALRNQRLRRVLAGADRLIAPADFVARWYADHGIPTQQLRVLVPGLALPPPVADAPVADHAPLTIGYVGGLTPQKGVHVLLAAFADVPDPARLHIAGDPQADPVYSARLQALAGPRVTFHGRLARDAVWKLLREVDVVAVTSLWYETFVFVISEAFAAGVPVIASNLGVVGDRVRDEVDGLHFPPGDAAALSAQLRRLQDEPALLARLRAGITPPPTMTEHVTAVERLYHTVVDGGMR